MRLLYALAHIASQMLFHWFLPREDQFPTEVIQQFASFDFAQATMGDWIEATAMVAECCPDLPWTQIALSNGGNGPERVATCAHQHLRALHERGARYIVFSDPEYPALLKAIDDPPLAFTVLGDLEPLRRPMVAIVGSRKASAGALRQSFLLGQYLASLGFTVVSGGAFGCDIAAHKGVLAACRGGLAHQAPAIIVQAGGLHRLYPRGNIDVFRDLLNNGAAIVSERLWRAPAHKHDFPIRNRIISGLAEETVVAIAGEHSGAIVTARCALNQGRDVSVLKPSPRDIRALGGLALIEEGARSFASAEAYFDQWISH